MKKISLLVSTVGLFLAGSALFAQSGDEILAKVEKALTGPQDYEASATMTLANLDNTAREQRGIHVWFAGTNKSMIKFVSPAGIEGISLLSDGEEAMYLYLPAQNKIRMIEGSLKNEDFQGTDFSYNEMGSYEYRGDYDATVTKETASQWTLTLTRKPGSTRAYDKIVMTVNKDNAVPQTVELYEKNALKKTMSILEIKQSGNYIVPVKIRVENFVRNHYTEMALTDVKFDQGLDAQGVFTKRFLKKRVN